MKTYRITTKTGDLYSSNTSFGNAKIIRYYGINKDDRTISFETKDGSFFTIPLENIGYIEEKETNEDNE